MLGKKLYYLIAELSVSDKRQLYNAHGASSDKRDTLFVKLLKSNPKNQQDFSVKLEKLSKDLSSKEVDQKERNKNLRRFIDFSAKRIEDLKLQELCKSNQKIRNYLLAQIYKKSERHDLNERYYDKANKESGDDYWVKISFKNAQLAHVYKSQMVQDQNYWRTLVKEKEELVSDYYQAEMANVVNAISRSYLDDRASIESFEFLFQSSEDLEPLIAVAPGNTEKIQYKLAQARFAFDNHTLFSSHIMEAESYFEEGLEDQKDISRIRREILVIKFLYGFSNGHYWSELESYMSEAVQIDDENNNWDPKLLFYLFILNAINGNDNKVLKEKYEIAFMKENAKYLFDFTDAISYIANDDVKSAKQILIETSYCNNPYVSLWSKLFEAVLNLGQGNIELGESIVKRAKRQVKGMETRLFCIPSCIVFLNMICKKYDLPVYKCPEQESTYTGKLSPVFQFASKYL